MSAQLATSRPALLEPAEPDIATETGPLAQSSAYRFRPLSGPLNMRRPGCPARASRPVLPQQARPGCRRP